MLKPFQAHRVVMNQHPSCIPASIQWSPHVKVVHNRIIPPPFSGVENRWSPFRGPAKSACICCYPYAQVSAWLLYAIYRYRPTEDCLSFPKWSFYSSIIAQLEPGPGSKCTGFPWNLIHVVDHLSSTTDMMWKYNKTSESFSWVFNWLRAIPFEILREGGRENFSAPPAGTFYFFTPPSYFPTPLPVIYIGYWLPREHEGVFLVLDSSCRGPYWKHSSIKRLDVPFLKGVCSSRTSRVVLSTKWRKFWFQWF